MGDSLIAVVDDDSLVRAATSSLLRSLDYDCATFASAEAFLAADPTTFGCLLSDIQMPGMSGIALAQAVHAGFPNLPVILMTAYPNERAASLRSFGLVSALLEKPLNGDAVVTAVRSAIGQEL